MQVFIYTPPSVPWLDLRYIDEDIIIINKPSGLLSNPGMAEHTFDSAVTRLQELYPETILVHRLDCDTSGIMVFARTKQAESNLKTQFQNKETQKEYIAEIEGHLMKESGTIDLSLGKDEKRVPLQKPKKDGRKAVTHYQVLEERNDNTLIKLLPETGRTHQLRVHMLALGHPILGDEFYANKSVIAKRQRLSLHARKLSFTHPMTKEWMSFVSKHSF
ncbi:RluA family pseudouridine synthase [Shewanella sp. 202IG2-18]|uniref:RluA family pseudouridine synthase n=1 Tax=Parashewanella hymeniacidonis TaxID=2807618 RepID=UPI001961EDD8|nr:RluA family pseudouridine synthase [Parashewanella hymeniacidonis]MBM7071242.1 RluA family pseudouridine synthase [Parashewanella hymeniacidonis]